MKTDSSDPRRKVILDAAFTTMAAYGYRRTSMEDIARAAGMSRPALYRFFRSKEDIFRAYVVMLMEATEAEARKGFQRPGSFAEKLLGALDAGFVSALRHINDSPHGEELVGVNYEIAPDLFETWLRKMETVVAEGISAESEAGAIDLASSGLKAGNIARTIVNAVEGVKKRSHTPDECVAEIEGVVRLVASAVAPRMAVPNQPT